MSRVIDGQSRMVVYLYRSNNNTAETILDLFTKAVQTYGFLLRVCGDRGTENTKVAGYMIAQGGTLRPFICGRCVRNQRIEHLWIMELEFFGIL